MSGAATGARHIDREALAARLLRAKLDGNDLINVDRVLAHSLPADFLAGSA
ncbi:hypothetical protein [Burkholderia anthina]|uniref:hypothetical protein n=1 Tax=Burkholderia anthina TaxID=179879 RepID=UPI000AFAC414|nr:hypothetical protein [Burkholderia anthina]